MKRIEVEEIILPHDENSAELHLVLGEKKTSVRSKLTFMSNRLGNKIAIKGIIESWADINWKTVTRNVKKLRMRILALPYLTC
jgi:hypothetical protein